MQFVILLRAHLLIQTHDLRDRHSADLTGRELGGVFFGRLMQQVAKLFLHLPVAVDGAIRGQEWRRYHCKARQIICQVNSVNAGQHVPEGGPGGGGGGGGRKRLGNLRTFGNKI